MNKKNSALVRTYEQFKNGGWRVIHIGKDDSEDSDITDLPGYGTAHKTRGHAERIEAIMFVYAMPNGTYLAETAGNEAAIKQLNGLFEADKDQTSDRHRWLPRL